MSRKVPIAAGTLWAGLGLLFSPVWAGSELRLPSIFGDHMVVQRDRPLPVWGWGLAGSEINVRLIQETARTTVAADGTWRVTLPAQASGEGSLRVTTADQTVEYQDVLLGDVWVCSGQSNMEWGLTASNGGEEEAAAANLRRLRLFVVPKATSNKLEADCQGRWQVCTPESAPTFSAVGYYFGKQISSQLNLPVGMIGTYWGGTPAEAWTSALAISAHDSLRMLTPANPDTPPHHEASVLYNAMIAPLIPFGIRGAIWYQGESNVGRARQYATLFPTMIRDWRHQWRQGDFPFYFVQLAPFRYGWADPAACAELWEAQSRTLQLPNTGMAVTNDIGDAKDIHPRNKRDVADRLARWALAKTYRREDVRFSGPTYAFHTVEGNAVRIHFEHAQGLKTRDGSPPTEFTIAGADRKFLPATAAIDGSTIVVRHSEIADPIAVRFAWHDTASPNLTNESGLPTSAFRTDDLRLLSEGSE